MAARRLSDDSLREVLDAYRTGGSFSQGAKLLEMPVPTFQSRLRMAQVREEAGTLAVEKPFAVEVLDGEDDVSIDDLLSARKRSYRAKAKAADARRLIPVKVTCDGPIGIAHFGDPHVDDDGTDLDLLESHLKIVNKTEGLFGANVGDYRNNWIGRLARLWAQQGTSAKQALALTRWLLGYIDWMYLVGGNHDAWSGADDPIEWIAAQTSALHQPHACRIELQFPNGRRVRVNARHDFKGHSMYNTAHGPAKAAQLGWRDHLLTCGHTHVSGFQVVKDPSSGLVSHCLRVASYKLHDRYAVEQGLPDQNIFMCPVTIIQPQYEDHDPRLITTIFTPETGADFLKFLRKRKAA